MRLYSLQRVPYNSCPTLLTSRAMPKVKSKTLTRWVKGQEYKRRLQKAKIVYPYPASDG